MPYARITILLRDGTSRSGVRIFPEPMILGESRAQARQLSAELLGHGAIEDVLVAEVPADDLAVVALLLGLQQRVQRGSLGDAIRADQISFLYSTLHGECSIFQTFSAAMALIDI
jgi:hypothetical protein